MPSNDYFSIEHRYFQPVLSPVALSAEHDNLQLEILLKRDFPGGPVAKTLSSQCKGPRFDP